jgi:hypothetical protein
MSNVVKFLISVNDEDDDCEDDDVTNGDDVWRTCDENRSGKLNLVSLIESFSYVLRKEHFLK